MSISFTGTLSSHLGKRIAFDYQHSFIKKVEDLVKLIEACAIPFPQSFSDRFLREFQSTDSANHAYQTELLCKLRSDVESVMSVEEDHAKLGVINVIRDEIGDLLGELNPGLSVDAVCAQYEERETERRRQQVTISAYNEALRTLQEKTHEFNQGIEEMKAIIFYSASQ